MHGANVNCVDDCGMTPLHVAIIHGWELHPYVCDKIVLLMLRCGADIELKDSESHTALTHAVIHNQIKIVKILLMRGAIIQPLILRYLKHLQCSNKVEEIRKNTFDIIFDYASWRQQSESLISSQLPENEGSSLYYLGVCLYDIVKLMAPQKS